MTVRGYRISTSGAALAIICFFLPWVSQSCGNEPPRVRSGWELAADGDRLVLLVPIVALVVLALGLLAWRRGYATRRVSVASIGLGLLALLFLFWRFGTAPPEGITRDILYGLWGVVAGNVLSVVGGILGVVTPSAPPQNTSARPNDSPAAAHAARSRAR
jgi:hypothetical protein